MSKCGCIRAKMVVFGQNWLHSCNVVVIGESVFGRKRFSSDEGISLRAKWLKWGKFSFIPSKMVVFRSVVVFGQSGCNFLKLVVFGQKWLYSCKMVLFGQKWLYLGKSGCIRAKVIVFRPSGCSRTKWLYSGKVVVSGEK